MQRFFQGWFLAAELMLLVCVGAAFANYDGTQGTGTHFVAFDATHSGTSLCAAANTQCVSFVVINSAGTEVGTVANPFQVTVANANANGQATMANSSPVVIASNQTPVPVSTADVCASNAKTNLAISFQTTSITQLIALSGTTKIYVCSVVLVASVATVFSITGGTGTNCGTPAALIGTTSATHGMSVAVNGGFTLGNGTGTVAVTGAGSELCIVQTGAGDLVGNLTYVQL